MSFFHFMGVDENKACLEKFDDVIKIFFAFWWRTSAGSPAVIIIYVWNQHSIPGKITNFQQEHIVLHVADVWIIYVVFKKKILFINGGYMLVSEA